MDVIGWTATVGVAVATAATGVAIWQGRIARRAVEAAERQARTSEEQLALLRRQLVDAGEQKSYAERQARASEQQAALLHQQLADAGQHTSYAERSAAGATVIKQTRQVVQALSSAENYLRTSIRGTNGWYWFVQADDAVRCLDASRASSVPPLPGTAAGALDEFHRAAGSLWDALKALERANLSFSWQKEGRRRHARQVTAGQKLEQLMHAETVVENAIREWLAAR
jgi:hypothetical protein